MANEIKLKRSSTTTAVPTTGDLALGELAINTFDGKLFLKKDDGAASVIEVGPALIGIDDNATGEVLDLTDTIMSLGSTAALTQYTIQPRSASGRLNISGGNASSTDGGFISLYNGIGAGDFILGADGNSVITWDESAGALRLFGSSGASKDLGMSIFTGGEIFFSEQVNFIAGTTAAPSLNVPEGVAPTIPVDGDFWITAAGEAMMRLNGVSVDLAAGGSGGIGGSITDNQIAVGATTADDIEGSSGLTFVAASTLLKLEGNVTRIDNNHSAATLDQGYWRMGYSEAQVWQIFDDALANSYEYFRVERSGTGASVQIDTIDFTAETDISLVAPDIIVGPSDTSTLNIYRPLNTGGLRIGAGNTASDGSNILGYGSGHAQGGDLYFSAGANTWLHFDESAGTLQISTGSGAKTLAAAWSANGFLQFHEAIAVQTGDRIYFDGGGDSHIREQSADLISFTVGGSLSWQASSTAITIYDNFIASGEASFAASTTARPSFNVAEGVAPTTPVDGDFWITAAGAAMMRLNGVSVDLTATGAGIGGSIADNQVAVGSAADTIEGTTAFTFDGTNVVLGGSGGYSIFGTADTGLTRIFSANGSTTGSGITFYGGAYPVFGGDISLASANASVLSWDESSGILRLFEGTGTPKVTAIQMLNDAAALGSSTLTGNYLLYRAGNVGGLTISGGSSATAGARITLRAGAHATLANDIAIGAGSDDDIFFWDDSFGDIQINTGSGASKTNTLNLASTLITAQIAAQFDSTVDIDSTLTVGANQSGQGILNIDSQTATSPILQFHVAGVTLSYVQHWLNQGLLLDSDEDIILRPGNNEVARFNSGVTQLAIGTQIGDGDHDVVLFGNAAGTAAQAGAFRSKLTLFGGASQTRTLEFYQVESGNAFINSSYTSNVLEVSGFASMASPDVLYIGNTKDVYFQRGSSNYIDVRNDGGAGTVMGLRFYDQADLGGYVRASGQALQLRGSDNNLGINIGSTSVVTLYNTGTVVALTTSAGLQVGTTTLTARLDLQGTATGSPEIRWMQNGVEKGSIQYLDSGDIFRIDADGEIQLSPFNSTEVTINATAAIFEANVQVKGQAWSDTQTLTQATTIAWNCDLGNSAVTTMTGNRTLGNPTNQKNGATYLLRIVQDGTGTRTLAYGTAWKFPGGTAPVLSTGAGDIDILSAVSDGTNMYAVLQKDFT